METPELYQPANDSGMLSANYGTYAQHEPWTLANAGTCDVISSYNANDGLVTANNLII